MQTNVQSQTWPICPHGNCRALWTCQHGMGTNHSLASDSSAVCNRLGHSGLGLALGCKSYLGLGLGLGLGLAQQHGMR